MNTILDYTKQMHIVLAEDGVCVDGRAPDASALVLCYLGVNPSDSPKLFTTLRNLAAMVLNESGYCACGVQYTDNKRCASCSRVRE